MITQEIFSRAELLLGSEAMKCLSEKRVIIFGVGGVGSWCAEALIRTGITHLTIVDFDSVSPSNINRQLMATTATIGQPKVEVLRQRLLAINPHAEITALQQMLTEDSIEQFHLASYDYVIDAIDSLKNKALLILKTCETDARLFSSMGAALKLDPSRIRVTEFWKVEGDPLARALRKRFKSMQQYPKHKFQCVFSDELLANQPIAAPNAERANGSLMHITAIFGLTLASLVIRDAAVRPIS
jgi:tRNA A37 threonylcarbamoyladenosine dehydratase